MLTLKIILLVLAGVLDIIFSFLVLARDRKKINNVSFFALAFSMGGWSLGIAGFLMSDQYDNAFNWAKLYYFFPLVISASLVLFALSFPSKGIKLKWSAIISLGFISLITPLVFVHDFLTKAIVYHDWGKEVVLNPIHYGFYSVYLLACFVTALFIMYRKSQSTQGLYRSQALFFFIGFTTASVFGVFFNLVLPAIGNYRLIWTGPPFTAVFIVSVAYSIVRHKMFDIQLVLARALSYVTSVIVLSFVYGFVVLGLSDLLFDITFKPLQLIFLSFATGIAGLSFSRIKRLFDHATNALFFQDAYEPQQLYDNLNRILVSTANIEKMLKTSSALFKDSIKAEYCAVGLRENTAAPMRIVGTQKVNISLEDIDSVRAITPRIHQTIIAVDYLEEEHLDLKELMVKNNVALLVRLSPNTRTNNEGLGYIVLGPKKSGNPYNKQDFRVLDTAAKSLIVAIQNATHFEEIQNFNVTLQQKINEATNKLKRTNEKLKELDETKDDFISMASHQLRTPLTSVKGYLSMVMEGDAGAINKTQKQMLGQAFFSSQRMVYLIADLLNVSRLKTGKFVIEQAPTNLDEVVAQEIDQLKESAASRSLTLQYDRPTDFPTTMLDETKIRQVIMNFIDNAIYYTPAGGQIDVRLLERPRTIELRIEDNGIGVPKHDQPHLFTKFYRGGNARRARPDGTGLGLFMAKKVIIAQGGSLIFNSEEGKGSTFGFVFSKAQLLPSPPAVRTAK